MSTLIEAERNERTFHTVFTRRRVPLFFQNLECQLRIGGLVKTNLPERRYRTTCTFIELLARYYRIIIKKEANLIDREFYFNVLKNS